MIVLQIHNCHVLAIEGEGNPPVSRYCHGPLPFPGPFERVQIHPGDIQLIWAARLIQRIENAADSAGMLGLYPPGVAFSEKPLKTFVLEILDHGF